MNCNQTINSISGLVLEEIRSARARAHCIVFYFHYGEI